MERSSQEVLRVHGPANSFFERIVPEDGVILAGYYIPGGAVRCSALYNYMSKLKPLAEDRRASLELSPQRAHISQPS